MKKEESLLDLLERLLTFSAQKIMKEVGYDITEKEAKNFIGKIGTRIVFRESLGEERIDEIILPSKKSGAKIKTNS